MEFRELLKRRRMVRAYEPDPIPRETLERIVGVVRRAPSAGHSQGQRVIVVTDPEQRARIADAIVEEYYAEQGYDRWIRVVPAILVVCTREQDYHDRYTQPDKTTDEGDEIEWPVPYWWVDAGAYAMLLILAALDEGLATGVFGVDGRRIGIFREVLALPDDVAFVCCITIGHGAPERGRDISSRATWPRKPLDELVRWERWS